MITDVFCRQLDANLRKQGAKRKSVLAHVTELSNTADEEVAPKSEQKSESTLSISWRELNLLPIQ
jgi:hypothetical protein